MSDAERNKQLVVTWLAALGESPEKAAEGITRDFRWVCPRSVSTLFDGAPREQRGLAGLRRLLGFDVEIYENGHHGKSDVHFLIGEGDRVAMQQDFETVAKNGHPYRNTYCFTFRVEGDKIAEVWEHADTLHSKQVCFDRPRGEATQGLAPDELLTTTRTVRKRLDFEKPVSRALVEECLEIAFQAPNGGNMNGWRWIAVDDRDAIRELARLYNQGLDDLIATFGEPGYPGAHVPGADRIESSTTHLRENFHRAPIVLLPLIAGRTDDGANAFFQASQWGSIVQAIWSFMLALRARGLGSAWTTGHLWREREVAELLGIPYAHYMQAGLFPVAYTLGTDFKRAYRKPVAEVLGWNHF